MYKFFQVVLYLMFFNFAMAQELAIVGESGCEFNSIQAAFDSGATEIRVVNKMTIRDSFVINRPVEIKGGFANCKNAASGILDIGEEGNVINSLWSGENLRTVVTVAGSEKTLASLTLSNFYISNGRFRNLTDAGGINVRDYSTLILKNVSITSNIGSAGGGIGIIGENTYVNVENSIIRNNQAKNGAGIFCVSGSAENKKIHTIYSSLIAQNNASSNGGGFYLDSNCHMLSSSRNNFEDTIPVLYQGGIVDNSAGFNGGGIYAINNSKFVVQGIENKPMILSNNLANEGVGGGAFIEDSKFILKEGRLQYNESLGLGGGIYANESIVELVKGEVSHNNVITNEDGYAFGGALFAEGFSNVSIKKIKFNQNSSEFNPFIYLFDFNEFLMESCIVTNHSPIDGTDIAYLMVASNQDLNNPGKFSLIHNTFAENEAVILTYFHGNGVIQSNIENNIIADNYEISTLFINQAPNTFIKATANALFNDDLPQNERVESSLNLITQDFGFINPAGGDFQLTPESHLIDYAPKPAFYSVQFNNYILFDYLNRPRGIDASNRNIYGLYDIGAFEYYLNLDIEDVIFKNGFE